jgi:two-component system chemotaxis response regulator CheY
MLRVMIVDDSERVREALRAFLQQSGYQVVGEAWDGKEAVALYPELKPDVVTMDIVMPEMDGLTALAEIRTHHPKARIIMLSSAAGRDNLATAKKWGAIAFLIKPLPRKDLLRVLKEIEKAIESERAA